MNFHLQFPLNPFPVKVNYSHKILFIGSCFAENIAEQMQYFKFDVKINPHGVLYNPASISLAIRRYLENKQMQEEDLFFANDCWNSWEHHSRFSNTDKQTCLKEMNAGIDAANQLLKTAGWLFITFGSAFYYQRTETGKLVGNCHKVPQKEFTRHLLTADEISTDYQQLILALQAINPDLKIVFTVSPVRYMNEGAMENTLSKGRLTEAVYSLLKQHEHVTYFPAFELIMDDLRDYRFYKSDLIHPNKQAIEYVFEKLMSAAFDEETKLLFEKIKDIKTAVSHRAFNPLSESTKKFNATYLQRCLQLQKQFPFLDLEEEQNKFFGK